ncbi:MAG TPA: TonB family protein [Stellaceae bacterium]
MSSEVRDVVLPVGLALRDLPASDDRWGWRDWLAVAAAAFLHAAVIISLIWDWRFPLSPPGETEPIPVRIVFAPPKPEPAPPPSPPLIGRESGKDQRTTAPPAADAPGPEATKPPEPSRPEPSPAQEKPAPSKDSAAAEPRKEAARHDPRKAADKARAPRPVTPQLLMLEPGEREETGDPYLNHARDLLERHRVYPKVMGQFGLPVEGTPVYAVLIDRTGGLRAVKLLHPSGAAALDEAGATMIRATAPFPPLPGNYPGEMLSMTITIHLFPAAP